MTAGEGGSYSSEFKKKPFSIVAGSSLDAGVGGRAACLFCFTYHSMLQAME